MTGEYDSNAQAGPGLSMLIIEQCYMRDRRKFRCFLKLIDHFCELMNDQEVQKTSATFTNEDRTQLAEHLYRSLSSQLSLGENMAGNLGTLVESLLTGASSSQAPKIKPTNSTGSNKSFNSINSSRISRSTGTTASKRSSVSSSR